MENDINITKILKDKSENTMLYSSLFGNVYLYLVDTNFVIVQHYGLYIRFLPNAKYSGYDEAEAEPTLFPSKEMRDWSKFSWKRGDILVSNDGGTEVIFDKWYDDTYTSFYCKHYLNSEDETKFVYYEEFLCTTERYAIEDKDKAQIYIGIIEERLGGKLNRETLEVEKAQPEFKDGDIVCISGMGYLAYGIVKSIDNSSKKLEYYVLNDMSTLKFEDWLSFEDKHIQPITETKQIILFDALTKKNKTWDAEKKMIVDLKTLQKFKPFDKVIIRLGDHDTWKADFYSHYCANGEAYTVGDVHISDPRYILPYEGNESLLGTANSPK